MTRDSYEFLRAMEEAPSPSGFEQPAQRIVRTRMKKYADSVTTDVHGNVIVALNPTGRPRVMLAGHIDQIGLMVRYISDEGYLHFSPIGGIDPALLPGSRVTVWNRRDPVEGVIGRKPVHLMRGKEADQPKIEIPDLWIDIGAKSRAEAEKRGLELLERLSHAVLRRWHEPDHGIWEERCGLCGECILARTGGICPIIRCSKSILNGPCGGSQDGKCEVNPDTPCAWTLIYEQLKRQGREDALYEVFPVKDWSKARDGGPRKPFGRIPGIKH